MTRIAAFDAGNTSGTAWWDGALVLGRVNGGGVDVDPLVRRRAAYLFLHSLPPLDALAYEQFVFRPGQGLYEKHADVVYINGAIEHEAAVRGVPVYRYTPKASKKRITDADLVRIDWWPPFGMRTGGHAADAARIMLCTLQDHYPGEVPNALQS